MRSGATATNKKFTASKAIGGSGIPTVRTRALPLRASSSSPSPPPPRRVTSPPFPRVVVGPPAPGPRCAAVLARFVCAALLAPKGIFLFEHKTGFGPATLTLASWRLV